MKKSNTPDTVEDKMDISSALEENRFIEFITNHGKKIVYAFLAILLLFIVMYRLSSGSKVKAENDFFNAENTFVKMQSHVGEENKEAFDSEAATLEAILDRHPELHQKYDGPLAQIFIFEGEPKQAEEFADRVFKRTKDEESPYYSNYAETTLLIANKKYEEALEKALLLKNSMENKQENQQKAFFGDTLYTLNLLRIAVLQQQLGHKAEELAAWQTLEQHAKNVMGDPKGKQVSQKQLFDRFAEGRITLLDYIQTRKNELKK